MGKGKIKQKLLFLKVEQKYERKNLVQPFPKIEIRILAQPFPKVEIRSSN